MSNSISFVGTIGKDATVKNLPSGSVVLNCTVANNTGFGDRKNTNWFNVSLFGKRAEGQLVDFLGKGQQVYISGEFNARDYQGQSGKGLSLDIVAHQIDLVGNKKANGGQSNRMPEPPPYD